jgi:hypothetical protein
VDRQLSDLDEVILLEFSGVVLLDIVVHHLLEGTNNLLSQRISNRLFIEL